MNFRSISDLNNLIRAGLNRVPPDIDLIVGIPRSGMLPATMLALHLDIPLTDINGFLNRQLLHGGTTRGQHRVCFGELKHALIVDDSVFSGGTFKSVCQSLEGVHFPKLSYLSIYGSEDFQDPKLITFETISAPRAFEWNIMYHPFILQRSCIDLDGILCFDPTPEQNEPEANYRDFLSAARPRFVPRTEVHSIVTSRLEKYRRETERWLERTGIRYKNLHMLDLPDAETRRRLGSHAKFKASVYSKSKSYVFIESEDWQAREIARISGRPAISLSARPQIFYGTWLNSQGVIGNLKRNTVLRKIFRKAKA